MYQIADLDPKEFSKIKVRNQSRILELTGSKFDPLKAYEIIKNETQDFTQDNGKAKQADALYIELLKVNGIVTKKNEEVMVEKKEDKERSVQNVVRIREQERARALKLLEIELQ